MPRYENLATGEYIEIINCDYGVRRGKIGEAQPKPFTNEELSEDILLNQGFVKTVPAGLVWDFIPNLEIENEIMQDRNNFESYKKYSKWLRGNGQTYLADLIDKGLPSLNENEFAYNRLLEQIFGDFDYRMKPDAYKLEENLINGFFRKIQIVSWYTIPFNGQHPLGLPVFRFLEILDVSGENIEDLISWLPGWECLPRLKKLSLWSTGYQDEDMPGGLPPGEDSNLGDFSLYWDKLSNLEIFYLTGLSVGIRLGKLSLPSVRHFARQSFTFQLEEFKIIINASWTNLECITLSFGPSSNVMPEDWYDFLKIKAPKLCKLAIRYYDPIDELIPILGESELLSRLTHISFYQSGLTSKGTDYLIKYKKEFAHLQMIDISETTLTDIDAKKLFDILPAVGKYNAFRKPNEIPYQFANYQEYFWEERNC